MIPSIRASLSLVARVSGRKRLAVAFVGSLLTGVLDLLGVSLVLPLIIAITDPAAADSLPSVLGSLVPETFDRGAALGLAVVVMAVFSVRSVVTMFFRWWLYGYVYRSEAALAAGLLDAYVRAPLSFHTNRNSADLIRMLELSVEQVFHRVVLSAVTMMTEAIVVVFLVGALAVLEPEIAAVTSAFFVVSGIVFSRLTSTRAVTVGSRYQREQLESLQAAQETLGGLVEIVVRNTSAQFTGRYSDARSRGSRSKQRFQFLNELPRIYLETTFLIGVCVIVMAVLATNDSSSSATASLVVVAAVGFRALPSLVKITGSATVLRTGIAALDLVEADIRGLTVDIASRLTDPQPITTSGTGPPSIELRTVSYRYDEDGPQVLSSIDLIAPRGSWVGIIGGSGVGKSTLLYILLGLLEPCAGEVIVDGEELSTEDLQLWRSRIGYVPQDVYLLDSSIAENVRFGLKDPDDEELLVTCLEQAALSEFVEALPHGADTSVGERGARISGGQRQRLGIARALYRRPGLLIMDEATASLDVDTERSITGSIAQLRETLTLITVAHRLSTVRRCDALFVLADGRVQASGTYDQLIRESAYFRELVELSNLE